MTAVAGHGGGHRRHRAGRRRADGATAFRFAAVLLLAVAATGVAIAAGPAHDGVADAEQARLDRQGWDARDGRARLRLRDAGGEDSGWIVPAQGNAVAADDWQRWQTPLGSLWKLFVYAFVDARSLSAPDYACHGNDPDEVYCCDPGATVDAQTALVRSCGLFFEPARLGIDANAWQAFWRAQQAPAWLHSLPALRPETVVPVSELLDALAVTPLSPAMRDALLDTVLAAPSEVVAELGGRVRVKTWSWQGSDALSRQGGFAGWLLDGSLLWVGGAGTSRTVLNAHARALAQVLPEATGASAAILSRADPGDPGHCVQVRMFARYAIERIEDAQGRALPHANRTETLHGRYTLRFANGNALAVESAGELLAQPLAADGEAAQAGNWRIQAHLDREDYVARVLDREAGAQPLAAARAMTVAIRSYLARNAQTGASCLAIDDSSRWQRVSPRPASAAARAVTQWTRDLVLDGGEVQYHRDKAGSDRLSWRQAVAQAQRGDGYANILASAFPVANLARWGSQSSQCEPLPAAQAWLLEQQPRWRESLDALPGHVEVPVFAVCRLSAGRPHVDRSRWRIFVGGHASQQQRLDLVHEYLHLAFDGHPLGHDEAFIESLARKLLLTLASQ